MSTRNRLMVASTLVAAFVALPVGPALADPPDNFGSHVSNCAQTIGFSGAHNPGMHQGASGWSGETCH